MPSEPLLWRTLELLARHVRRHRSDRRAGRGGGLPGAAAVVTCRVVTEVVGAVDALVNAPG